jgi:hypothetical protein
MVLVLALEVLLVVGVVMVVVMGDAAQLWGPFF